MWNLESIDKENSQNGKLKPVFQKINNFIKDTLCTKRIRKWDVKYIWKFDDDWNIVEWTVDYGQGFRTIWKYVNENGHIVLREWKKIFSDGSRLEWKFDKYERFIEWERHLKNGFVHRWKFDVNTGDLIRWEQILPNWEIRKINKYK